MVEEEGDGGSEDGCHEAEAWKGDGDDDLELPYLELSSRASFTEETESAIPSSVEVIFTSLPPKKPEPTRFG